MNSRITSAQSEIPAFTYLRAWNKHADEIRAAIDRVLNSGTLILGPEVAEFENEFAQFVASRFAIGVSSGTDALIVALRALKVTSGDEVITVANGPVPTIAAIRAVGAVPKFIDVDRNSLQIDPGRLIGAMTDRTRCIIPIHLYGFPAPIEEIINIAGARNIPVIEDCAQAHGTYVAGRHAGTLGTIGCFSFYPTKNLGAFGDGGLCVTQDEELATKIRQIARYGFREDRIAYCEGLNCRLDELQAAILRVRLRYLRSDLRRRTEIAARYCTELVSSALTLPAIPSSGTHAWHLYVARVQQRSRWIERLKEHGILTGVHYPNPVHLMPAFQWLGYSAGDLPVTEHVCREVLSLPMFPELTDAEIDRVIDVLRSVGQ